MIKKTKNADECSKLSVSVQETKFCGGLEDGFPTSENKRIQNCSNLKQPVLNNFYVNQLNFNASRLAQNWEYQIPVRNERLDPFVWLIIVNSFISEINCSYWFCEFVWSMLPCSFVMVHSWAAILRMHSVRDWPESLCCSLSSSFVFWVIIFWDCVFVPFSSSFGCLLLALAIVMLHLWLSNRTFAAWLVVTKFVQSWVNSCCSKCVHRNVPFSLKLMYFFCDSIWVCFLFPNSVVFSNKCLAFWMLPQHFRPKFWDDLVWSKC